MAKKKRLPARAGGARIGRAKVKTSNSEKDQT